MWIWRALDLFRVLCTQTTVSRAGTPVDVVETLLLALARAVNLDDGQYVTENPYLQRLSWDSLRWAWTSVTRSR